MTYNKQRLFPYRTLAGWSLMEIVCFSEGRFEYLRTVPKNFSFRKVRQVQDVKTAIASNANPYDAIGDTLVDRHYKIAGSLFHNITSCTCQSLRHVFLGGREACRIKLILSASICHQGKVRAHACRWMRWRGGKGVYLRNVDPSGRAVSGVGLRPLFCWDCEFESCRAHGCLSVVSVVCCQVEVSA
jgi:hypothetical protein